MYSEHFDGDKRIQTENSYLRHPKYINLRSSLDTIVGSVNINLLEHCGVVGLSQTKGGKDSAPMVSLDSTIGLRWGRSQESAPPSDSEHVALIVGL